MSTSDEGPKRPCRRCAVLRLFIAAVVTLATIGILAPEKLAFAQNLTTMDAAIGVVVILAIFAGTRHILDWLLGPAEKNE